jgi:hypothetical protein
MFIVIIVWGDVIETIFIDDGSSVRVAISVTSVKRSVIMSVVNHNDTTSNNSHNATPSNRCHTNVVRTIRMTARGRVVVIIIVGVVRVSVSMFVK